MKGTSSGWLGHHQSPFLLHGKAGIPTRRATTTTASKTHAMGGLCENATRTRTLAGHGECQWLACFSGAVFDLNSWTCECPDPNASYNASAQECQCLGDNEAFDEGLDLCVCDAEFFRGQGSVCTPCEGPCGEGYEETTACAESTDRACSECDEGYYCLDGIANPCTAPQGQYCPAFYRPTTRPDLYASLGGARRSADLSAHLAGIPCPAGYFCAGQTAGPEPCEAAEGFYCPSAFAPGADVGLDAALAGRRCPPASFCAGSTSEPVPVEPICDLARACGASGNASCAARQSTFYKLDDPPAGFALDGSGSSCIKTADAVTDPNPQWLGVALPALTLVGTVRFVSTGSPDDFNVLVAAQDAEAQGELNPSAGAALPDGMELCPVNATAAAGVFEAHCEAAVQGAFVFIARSARKSELEVCDVEVFGHRCLPSQEVSCPPGYHPASCTGDQLCPGCVPCPEGRYSDKTGPDACTPCPGLVEYGEQRYSPAGSTSVFQCEFGAYLDSTSTLAVEEVQFDESLDAWHIDVAFSQGLKIQINGLAALYLSDGGESYKPDIYTASQFPCRADTSQGVGADLSASLTETVCCLQDMREEYVMTRLFRDFTDGLDLVAANDQCDAQDGSEVLVNANLEVIGQGTEFVDVNGNSFANPITLVPRGGSGRRAYGEGMQYARITVPDAELFKISRAHTVANAATNLTDTRELFVGLLDMLPTGTRIVDSSSQQISIKLTRTQFGNFAAYGAQNIDYDFLSFLNARAHKVIDQRAAGDKTQYFLEITYIYDDRLVPVEEGAPVVASSVAVDGSPEATCSDSQLPADFLAVVRGQRCGPSGLQWGLVGPGASECPQISIPEDRFGRLYVPLHADPAASSVHVSFKLNLKDASGRDAELEVDFDVAASDYVTWCDATAASVDLADRVIPAITIGTQVRNPPRLDKFDADADTFNSEAETLQDGLITVELRLNETDGLDSNLEVFFEDVLVIQINPGSEPSATEIKDPDGVYIPTYTYDPDTRDARLDIPSELRTACSNLSYSESFFGCVYKHVLAEEEITDPEWAYLVGSTDDSAPNAQDFMETMLGDGTASVAARQLGREYEAELLDDGFATPKKIALWVNPGHKWGQTVHNSAYSLSKDVVVYVLFGVRSGVDRTTRRSLLQVGGDGQSAIMQAIRYEVTAASLMESVLEDVVVVEVKAQMAMPPEEACGSPAALRAACARRLRAAVEAHASPIASVQCLAVAVEEGACSRRAAGEVAVEVEAVIALEEAGAASERGVFLDLDAVVDSGEVLSMTQTAGRTFESGDRDGATDVEVPAPDAADAEGGVNVAVIAGAAGAAVVVMLLAMAARQLLCRGGRGAESDLEASVVEHLPLDKDATMAKAGTMDKAEMEAVLFSHAPTGTVEEQDVTIDALLSKR